MALWNYGSSGLVIQETIFGEFCAMPSFAATWNYHCEIIFLSFPQKTPRRKLKTLTASWGLLQPATNCHLGSYICSCHCLGNLTHFEVGRWFLPTISNERSLSILLQHQRPPIALASQYWICVWCLCPPHHWLSFPVNQMTSSLSSAHWSLYKRKRGTLAQEMNPSALQYGSTACACSQLRYHGFINLFRPPSTSCLSCNRMDVANWHCLIVGSDTHLCKSSAISTRGSNQDLETVVLSLPEENYWAVTGIWLKISVYIQNR